VRQAGQPTRSKRPLPAYSCLFSTVMLERCRYYDYFYFFDDLLRILLRPIDEILLLIRARMLRFPSSFAVSSTLRSLTLLASAFPPAAVAAFSERGGRGGTF